MLVLAGCEKEAAEDAVEEAETGPPFELADDGKNDDAAPLLEDDRCWCCWCWRFRPRGAGVLNVSDTLRVRTPLLPPFPSCWLLLPPLPPPLAVACDGCCCFVRCAAPALRLLRPLLEWRLAEDEDEFDGAVIPQGRSRPPGPRVPRILDHGA